MIAKIAIRKTANINVKNAVYRHVNGKIAQLKHQISEISCVAR